MVRLGDAAQRSDAVRLLLAASLWAGSAANACTTNHDALARQPKAGSSTGGTGGGSGLASGGLGNTGNRAQGGRDNPDDEAKGDDVLTIVNGVVDAPRVRLCFARVNDEGETGDFVGAPSPELGYAAHAVLPAIDGLSFVDDVIQPWVISGELARVDKLDCRAAVELAEEEEAKVTPNDAEPAGGGQGGAAGDEGVAGAGGATENSLELSTLRARPLAALPAGTVNIGRSILLVLSGCIGGAAYTDRVEASACGAGYTPQTPTLKPVIVKLSRAVGLGKIGLQGVHASQATAAIDVRASGDSGVVALVFASTLGFGAIEPRPADTRFDPSELGVERFNYGLQAVDANGAVVYQEAWLDILTASELATPVAARSYTAIFLGPDPLLLKEGWWNKSAFALIDNDPTRP